MSGCDEKTFNTLVLWQTVNQIAFRKVSTISSSLIRLAPFKPKEFNRKPRHLNELKRCKVTDFRQILFYTGPLVIKNNVNKDQIYKLSCVTCCSYHDISSTVLN